eukprot:Skav217778  [mRNA]  locus=scaffold1782:97078:99983:- [translate_table: standard]
MIDQIYVPTAGLEKIRENRPGVAVEVMHAHSGAQLESRLQMMEQQLQSLKASTRSSSPSRALDRKTDTTEQKLVQLEAKFREQRSQWTSHEDQIAKIKDSLAKEFLADSGKHFVNKRKAMASIKFY